MAALCYPFYIGILLQFHCPILSVSSCVCIYCGLFVCRYWPTRQHLVTCVRVLACVSALVYVCVCVCVYAVILCIIRRRQFLMPGVVYTIVGLPNCETNKRKS